MEIILISIIVILIVIVVIIANTKSKEIQYYKILEKNAGSMNIIQNMFEVMGTNQSTTEKLEKLNKSILDNYLVKYSSLVIFDGVNYKVSATNLDEEFQESLLKIPENQSFSTNIIKNVSKYLTTTKGKNLEYNSAVERNIKSSMFSPIYNKDVYMGYWMIESDSENAFDDISKDEITKIKNNLGVFIENIQYQNMLELAENTDKQTGLYNSLYLYSNIRKQIIQTEYSTLILLEFGNLPMINAEYSREIGNTLLSKAINIIKETLGTDMVAVRLTGIKFLIIVLNSDSSTVHKYVERLHTAIIQNAKLLEKKEEVSLDLQVVLHTIFRQGNLDLELSKMSEALNQIKDTNSIKII